VSSIIADPFHQFDRDALSFLRYIQQRVQRLARFLVGGVNCKACRGLAEGKTEVVVAELDQCGGRYVVVFGGGSE
jgi:hypothetical protein